MIAMDMFDLIAFLVFVTGIVLFVRFFIFNPYTVIGKSMNPTFAESDFIIVDKVTPRRWELTRGDIVVFVPKNKTLPFIKRIVALPWETVHIASGSVEVCTTGDPENCELLNEYYLPEGLQTSAAACGKTEFAVTEWWYFVMGDNRDHSTDSRCCFGLWCYSDSNYLVYPEDMIGKVLMRLYPSMDGFW